eukprot:m.258254 g.258254  ORF g.258254 m.258254 type:complete len:607 (+) comp36352_c0_seq1:191-2011(+)
MADPDVVNMDTGNGADVSHMSVVTLTRLIANLQTHVDLSLRLASAKELANIAIALGPDRTRDELIPYLIGCGVDESDEVTDVICGELANFGPLVGGEQHVHTLLPLLEEIAQGEEEVTRVKAIVGLGKLAKQMPVANMLHWMLPMLERLIKGRYNTQRTSACGLFHIVYPVAEPQIQQELLGWLDRLCLDPATMVRRAVAESLQEIIPLVDKKSLSDFIHPMFIKLSEDEQDSVRLLVGKLCVVFAKDLNPQEVRQGVLPSLHKLMKDSAWRVRYVIADKFVELQAVVGPEIAESDLLPAFVDLLGDNESEVRAAAAGQVVNFCKDLPEGARVGAVLTGALPRLQVLVEDSSDHVRCSLASVIMGLAIIIGKDNTIQHLLPLFLKLLKDQFSDVRLKIISNLDAINKVVGISQLAQALEPAINELLTHENFRVRLATIELIPLVAKQLGVAYYDSELSVKFMDSLLDRIYSVRAAAINNIAKLVEYFGVEWAKTSLLPKVLTVARERKTYIARLVTLLAINRLVEVCPKDVVEEIFIPVVCLAAQDKIANIRFNVGKIFVKIVPLIESSVYASKIGAIVEVLVKDGDRDVRYHALQTKQIAKLTYG